MKLTQVHIENFRHIQDLTLDFTDAMSRVRDVMLIVGPNTSGKTTVLDAIGIGLGMATRFFYERPGLIFSLPNIVRRGELQARVTYKVQFSAQEIAAIRELHQLAELTTEDYEVPDSEQVTLRWEYPDRKGISNQGVVHYTPEHGTNLFKGRFRAAQLLSAGRTNWQWFERVGAILSFDQQRTVWAKNIPADIWNIINYGKPENAANDRRTNDPKTILLSMAVRDNIPTTNGHHPQDQFKRIQQRYAEICTPHTLKGLVQDDLGQLDLLFSDGDYEYHYEGLSSGEQMLLLFLIRIISDHIHQSVVLVDEIELHQHPLWQQRLLYLLPRIGINNQIITTTHSDYLRDSAPQDAIIVLGDLGDTGARA